MALTRALSVFKLHAGLILFVLAYFLAAKTTAAAMGKALEIPWNFNVFLSLVLFGLAAHVVSSVWTDRPEQPFQYLAGHSRAFLTLELIPVRVHDDDSAAAARRGVDRYAGLERLIEELRREV